MNKAHFLYKYYLQLPIKREAYLLSTAFRVQRIIQVLLQNKNVPAISEEFSQKHGIRIHILCSRLSLESLLLSLASFYVFSREYCDIIIHEDGTFTKRDFNAIKTLFPWVVIIPLEAADDILRTEKFSDETIQLRHEHKLLIKAIDFHHVRSADRTLIIDTDIFLLHSMDELWDTIVAGKEFVFNNDPEPAYGTAKELLEKATGRTFRMDPSLCVNTGLIVEPSAFLRQQKEVINGYCKEFRDFSFEREHCLEQGYIACVLQDGGVYGHTLSDRYAMISHREPQRIAWIKEYDFRNNSDKIETIHLCGWDKLGRDFRLIRNKLLKTIEEKIS